MLCYVAACKKGFASPSARRESLFCPGCLEHSNKVTGREVKHGVWESCDSGTPGLYVYSGGVVVRIFLGFSIIADDLYGKSGQPELWTLTTMNSVLRTPQPKQCLSKLRMGVSFVNPVVSIVHI